MGTKSATSNSTLDGANGGTLSAPPQMPDEEEIRRTAYFLWEQDGRPMGQDDHYWWSALEKIARSRSSDALMQNGYPDPDGGQTRESASAR
jgi:hypothetical protein